MGVLVVISVSMVLSIPIKVAFATVSDNRSYNLVSTEALIDDSLTRVCGRSVTVCNSTVDIVHRTAKEFLLSGLSSHGLGMAEANHILADICTSYLLDDGLRQLQGDHPVRENVCDGPDQVGTDQENEEEKREKSAEEESQLACQDTIQHSPVKHAFLIYAAKHWTDHFLAAKEKADPQLRERAQRICRTNSVHFSIWFPILSAYGLT
jgi:hypothetical protein